MAETIAAIATAAGVGGIGVVRVSGPNARNIASAVVGRVPDPRVATFARFRDGAGEAIDHGLALFFPAPNSYTGEDVLELHGHGGRAVLALLLAACLAAGARAARGGEFSERAYLNGKLDLAQAEAVADLIEAQSAAQARAALRSLDGVFSDAVHALADRLTGLRVYIEAAIDFPDEEIEFLERGRVAEQLTEIAAALAELKRQATRGVRLTDGATVAIIGAPNAGKSSLLNALTFSERAIVTPIAGTTRDVLRESIDLDGVPLTLIDTAGLRETLDPIEAEGVRRAALELERADLVLWVRDLTDPNRALPFPLDAALQPIEVWNKADLAQTGIPSDALAVSAKTGAGLEALRAALKTRIGLSGSLDGSFSARQRHLDALDRAADALATARALLDRRQHAELIAEDLRASAHALGEIVGELSADQLLGEIFGRFCIGK